MTDENEWMTVLEAADLSGYHHNYLRELIYSGKVSAIKKEGRWQVNRKSLLAYKEAAEERGDRRWGPKDE